MKEFGVTLSKEEESDEEPIETESATDFDIMTVFIISETSWILVFWRPIEIISYLLSSYYYAWMTAYSLEEETIPTMSIFWEFVFLMTMMITFLTEFTPDGETIPVRNLTKIAQNYFKKGFMFDFVTLLPIPWIFYTMHYSHLFYGIKVIRTVKGIKVFDVTEALNWIKEKV